MTATDRGHRGRFFVPTVVGFVILVRVLVVAVVLIVGVLRVIGVVIGIAVDDLDVVIDVVVLVVGVEVDFVLVGLILVRFVEVFVLELIVFGFDVRLADGVGLQFGDVLGGRFDLAFGVVVVLAVRRSHRLEHRVLTGWMGRHLRDRD